MRWIRSAWVAILLVPTSVLLAVVIIRLPPADMEFFDPIYQDCLLAGGQCDIDFTRYADFAWERMAFVRMWADPTATAAALGIPSFYMEEFNNGIFFMQGDRIVHQVLIPYEVERPSNHAVFMDFGDSPVKFFVCSRAQAVFHGVIEDFEGYRNVWLTAR